MHSEKSYQIKVGIEKVKREIEKEIVEWMEKEF